MRTRFSVQNILIVTFALIPVGLIFAPFLLSLCMLFSVLIALWRIDLSPFAIRFRPTAKDWVAFKGAPHFWVLCALFFFTFWGIWELQDMGYWLSRLRIKLPFLVLPLAFFFLPRLGNRTLDGLLYYLVLLLAITSSGVLIFYLINMEEINALIKQGKPIPLPCNHVRFSLLLVFGLLSSLYLYVQRYYWWKSWEKNLQLALAAFLFLFLHILSVRTGIVVLYTTLLLLTFRYVMKTRRYWIGLCLVGAMTLFPLIAYQNIPSLRAKVDYVKYDLFMYRHGHTDKALSDAGRWVSLELGWEVFQERPWWGVGVGNLKQAMNQKYAAYYPELEQYERKMPHNQWLSMLAAGGIIGGLMFSCFFFYPLFYKENYQHWLILGLYVIVGLSFLVENTIENAMGVGFFLYYLLHLLLRFTTKPQPSSRGETGAPGSSHR